MGITARIIPRKEVLEKLERQFPDFRPYYIEAIQALFVLSADLEKSMDAHFANQCKFSRARYLVLLVILHCEEHRMTPNEIAKKLNVTRGNMTGLIDGLLKDGFVTKKLDKEDRRQVWIEVTPKAKERLNEILPDYYRRMAKFMSVLKKEEIESFTKISRKLQASVDAFTELG